MSDIKKFFNNHFYLLSFILIFVLLTLYLFSKMQYAIVANDDLALYIRDEIKYSHERYIYQLLSAFIIKDLPNLLNINIQDFAIISEGLIKCIFFGITVSIVNYAFFKNHNKKYMGLLFIVSYFTILSVICQEDCLFLFDTYAFFSGYMIPIIFFLLFFLQISDFYIYNKPFSIRDYILQFIYIIMIISGNELILLAAIILTLILITELIIENKNSLKSVFTEKKINCYVIPLIILTFGCFLIFGKNNYNLYTIYKMDITIPSLQEIINFIFLYFEEIFIDNSLLWIMIITSITALAINKNAENKRIIKLNIYTICSFLAFYCATLFTPQTNIYTDYKYKFWLLCPFLLLQLSLFLYFSILFMCGKLIFENEYINFNRKKTFSVILIIIYTLCLGLINKLNFKPIKFQFFTDVKAQTKLYLLDKITTFYFRQNKPAIIPINDDISSIIAFYAIKKENAENYLYKKYNYADLNYSDYLIYAYNIDPTKGYILKPQKEAIKDYLKAGGTLTKEELYYLNFEEIEKDLENESQNSAK